MRPARLLALSIVTLSLAGAPATAQSVTSAPAAAVAASPSSGPTLGSATVGVQRLDRAPSTDPAPGRGDTKQNRALMIVGGAALVVGLVIGGGAGTLIAIGGAVVGLVGLYQYLQ